MKKKITVEHEIEWEGGECSPCCGRLDVGNEECYLPDSPILLRHTNGDCTAGTFERCKECLRAIGDKPEEVKPSGHNIILDDADAQEMARTAEDDLRDFGVMGND